MGAGKLFKKYRDEELLQASKAKGMLLANGIQRLATALKESAIEFGRLPKAINAVNMYKV